MERRHHGAARKQVCRLLRGTALGYRKRIRAAGIEAKRVDAIDHDFPHQFGSKGTQQFAMPFPGNGGNHNLCISGCVMICHALDAVTDLGRGGGGSFLAPGSDNDPITGPREPVSEAFSLVTSTAEDSDDDVFHIDGHGLDPARHPARSDNRDSPYG